MLRRFNERTRARLLAPLPGAFGRPLRGHVHRFSPAPAFSQRPALCSQYSATTHPHHCVCEYSAVNCYPGQSLPSSIARQMGGVNRNRMAKIEWHKSDAFGDAAVGVFAVGVIGCVYVLWTIAIGEAGGHRQAG